jgi:hypothetical protein
MISNKNDGTVTIFLETGNKNDVTVSIVGSIGNDVTLLSAVKMPTNDFLL